MSNLIMKINQKIACNQNKLIQKYHHVDQTLVICINSENKKIIVKFKL